MRPPHSRSPAGLEARTVDRRGPPSPPARSSSTHRSRRRARTRRPRPASDSAAFAVVAPRIDLQHVLARRARCHQRADACATERRAHQLPGTAQDGVAGDDARLRGHVPGTGRPDRGLVRKQHQSGAAVHRRVEMDEHRAGKATGERHDRQEPPAATHRREDELEVQCLLAHRCASCLGRGAGATPWNISSLSSRRVPFSPPTPTSVVDGTRRPKTGEYHPSGGSVSPRRVAQVRPSGSDKVACCRPIGAGPSQVGSGAVQECSDLRPEVEQQLDLVLTSRRQQVRHDQSPVVGPESYGALVADGAARQLRVSVVHRRPHAGRRPLPSGRAARTSWHGAPTGTARPTPTGRARDARACCGRASSGSTPATPARRGSSTCPGRRGCRRRRGEPRRESASACAWAAIDRKPCGPPSQRHQISGPSPPACAAA